MRTVPPRLNGLLARESATALLFVRKRARLVCTVGWDRSSDTFTMGQWLRARIDARRSDLSPDGRHFVYFVFDGRRVLRGQTAAYTAVARTPYLKAVEFWPSGDTYHGGGLFLDNSKVSAQGGYSSAKPHSPGLDVVASPVRQDGSHLGTEGVYFPRLIRDGWTLRQYVRSPWCTAVFDRPLIPPAVLEKRFHFAMTPKRAGRGVYYEEHAVIVGITREDHADWEWAEVDAVRHRVVYASGGCLFAAPLDESGVGPAVPLFDARALAFEAIEAPYEDVR